jgi:LPXTG-motif cell wall-anchored protein
MTAAATVLWLLIAPSAAGPVTARATASRAEVSLGEAFEVRVAVAGPAGTTWTFPDQAGDDSVELRLEPEAPLADPGTAPPSSRRYRATAYVLDDARVPPIAVRYRAPDGSSGEVRTEPLSLRVLSVLPKDPKQQGLSDVRGPVALSIGWQFWAALVGIVALLGGAILMLLRRRRRRRGPAPATGPEVPPETEALSALARLEASGLLAADDLRAFYIDLTEIVKRYLERRLAAPVLEMTSSEMAALLRDHPKARDVAAPVRDLTAAADRVKFAHGRALEDEARQHLSQARSAVQTVEERCKPVPSRDARSAA